MFRRLRARVPREAAPPHQPLLPIAKEASPPGRRALPVLFGVLLSACGVTVERPGPDGADWMSQSEFRDYAKSVLQRQNAVQNELIFRLPELENEDPERYHRLLEAEDRLIDACQLLVESVMKRLRGGELDYTDQLAFPEQTTRCDRETRRVEEVLGREPADSGE